MTARDQFVCGRFAPLSSASEEELLAAMAEIERGEFVSPEELLESLRKYG